MQNFNQGWSGPHQVVETRGVVVTVRETSTGRVYNTHHDRLSNPIFSRKFTPKFDGVARFAGGGAPLAGGGAPANGGVAIGNPRENPMEPEEDSEPAENPELALRRSRYGRILKSKRDSSFDYTSVLVENSNSHSGVANFQSFNDFCLMFTSSSIIPKSSILQSSPPAAAGVKSITQLRRELAAKGEMVYYVDTPGGAQWMLMLRETGTIMVYRPELGTFINPPTEVLLEDLDSHTPWPRRFIYRALTIDEVVLPGSLMDFPGWTDGSESYLQPRYGYTDSWLSYVRSRAESLGKTLPQLQIAPVFGGVMGTAAPRLGVATSTAQIAITTPGVAPLPPVESLLRSRATTTGAAAVVYECVWAANSCGFDFCAHSWAADDCNSASVCVSSAGGACFLVRNDCAVPSVNGCSDCGVNSRDANYTVGGGDSLSAGYAFSGHGGATYACENRNSGAYWSCCRLGAARAWLAAGSGVAYRSTGRHNDRGSRPGTCRGT